LDNLAKYIKSKTILFSAILAVMGVLELNLGLLEGLLGDWYGVVFILISAITAFLRVMTVVPISDK
jgi:hypothetical protein